MSPLLFADARDYPPDRGRNQSKRLEREYLSGYEAAPCGLAVRLHAILRDPNLENVRRAPLDRRSADPTGQVLYRLRVVIGHSFDSSPTGLHFVVRRGPRPMSVLGAAHETLSRHGADGDPRPDPGGMLIYPSLLVANEGLS